IVTALQLMRLRGEVRSSKEQEIIERQVQHLVRLVDDLLDISKITRGKVRLDTRVVELNGIVAKAVEIASPLFEHRGHNLAISVPRQGMWLDADETRLAQVIANLLTNAAKYTEPGGNIALRAWRDGHEIVLQVKDDGVGIAPDLLPRVFDLFVQGYRTPDRGQGGLGIGLALVRNLVSLHHGTVVALSDGEGKGSEFVVRLPAVAHGAATADAAAARASDHKAESVPSTIPRRILVVDDNEDAADLLAEMLAAFGHEVVVAHDGAEALALLERFTPEVAVLDIGLPVMDGYELAAKIRERLPSAPPRMMAVTGYGQEHDRERSKAAGFERHFVGLARRRRVNEVRAGGVPSSQRPPIDVERLTREPATRRSCRNRRAESSTA
ncbi:MAG: response regulator, partial [Myxococcales bacterium]|nr:response regulator [Myxococcales bacterium]